MTCFTLPTGETVCQYCKRTHLPYSNVWKRLEKGMSLEEAIKDASKRIPKSVINRKYFYKGKWIGEYVDAQGTAYRRVIRRLKRGWSMEKAMLAEGVNNELNAR